MVGLDVDFDYIRQPIRERSYCREVLWAVVQPGDYRAAKYRFCADRVEPQQVIDNLSVVDAGVFFVQLG